MDQRLKDAAQCGDMNSLYTLIQEDPYLLEHIDKVPFVDTPLHVAVSAGHIQFSMEMMRLKPSYARKPNQQGFSPIHLALRNDQTELVLRLIAVDRDLVRVQGREGITPLHFVAAEGNYVDLLAEFLAACPKSIQDLTIRKETALHIAVKNNNLEGLKVLLGWLEHVDKDVVLKWTDDEGNTVLHIAASKNQIEMTRLLITRVDINAKNMQGLTALDILQNLRSRSENELKIILLRAGALNGISLPSVTTLPDSLKKKISRHEKWVISHYRRRLDMSDGDRNLILVVAVLIAAANYQALLSSSSGDDDQRRCDSVDYRHYNYYHCLSETVISFFNVIAFLASMIEIYLHLPGGHNVLQLVLAILIFNALVLTSIPIYSLTGFFIILLLLFFGYFSKFSVILHKLNPMLNYKRSMGVKHSLFKHRSSFHRELSP